jgi:hypothetical protein
MIKTSINDDFEVNEEDQQPHISPGPGQYLELFQTSVFGKNSILHEYPQNFGTMSKRFNDKTIGS